MTKGETTVRRADKEHDVKVSKLTEEDDIEAYLTTLSAWCGPTRSLKHDGYTNLLHSWWGRPSKLTQQAYTAMGTAEAGDYSRLKAAVLHWYDINDEKLQTMFSDIHKEEQWSKPWIGCIVEQGLKLRSVTGQFPDKFHQLMFTMWPDTLKKLLQALLEDLATKWMQDCTSMTEMWDVIMKKQRERKPKLDQSGGRTGRQLCPGQKVIRWQ